MLTRLRGLLTFLLGLLACLAIPLSLATGWTVNTVASRSQYQATLDPLAQDPALLRYVSAVAADSLYGALPPLTASIRHDPHVEQLMRRDVALALLSSSFRDLWDSSVRRSHPAAVVVLLNRSGAPLLNRQGVVIDVSPILNQVVFNLDLEGIHQFDTLRADLVAFHPLRFRVLTVTQVKEARHVFGALDDLRWLVPALALIGLAGALAFGRQRVLALAGVATGTVVSTGVCLLALLGVRALAVHRAAGARADRTVSPLVYDTLSRGLWVDLYVCLGVAVIVAVGAWILDSRLSRRRAGALLDATAETAGGTSESQAAGATAEPLEAGPIQEPEEPSEPEVAPEAEGGEERPAELVESTEGSPEGEAAGAARPADVDGGTEGPSATNAGSDAEESPESELAPEQERDRAPEKAPPTP